MQAFDMQQLSFIIETWHIQGQNCTSLSVTTYFNAETKQEFIISTSQGKID